MSDQSNTQRLWLLGGEDVELRLPLARKLRALGYDVTLVGSCYPPRCKVGDEFRHLHYPLSRRFRPLEDVRTVFALARALRKHRPHLVHVFDTKPNLFAPLAAIGMQDIRIVRTITGMGNTFLTRGIMGSVARSVYHLAQRLAGKLSAVTICQNSEDHSYFIGRGLIQRSKAILIKGSGVDVKALTSRGLVGRDRHEARDKLGATDRIMVLMLSRVVRSKGVVEYARAAQLLEQRPIRFVLAGPFDEHAPDALDDETTKYLQSHVVCLGFRKDVPELISAADIVVLPSYREGIPRVLLEAQALSKPVVACDVPGCREVVNHGVDGLLVPAQQAEPLAASIATLADNEEQRREMGERGARKIREQFDLSLIARQYVECYSSLYQPKAS
jgi:glycosyltransferase involved in cell wall biosynthesis